MITRFKQQKPWLGTTAYLFPYSILASQFKFTILVVLIVPLGFMASGQKFLEPSEFLRIFIWIELKN